MDSLRKLNSPLVRFEALLVLASGLAAAQGESISIEEKTQLAERFFQAPGSVWVANEQPFWKHHVVLKLKATSDHRWVHRPSVAIDEQDKATMLSDGCIRMPQQSIVDGFNRIAVAESVLIDRENVVAYAQFFVRVHLLSRDELLSVPEELVEGIVRNAVNSEASKAFLSTLANSPGIAVEVSEADEGGGADGFDVTVHLWNWKGDWVAEHTFTIHRNGSIKLGDTRYENQSSSSSRSTLPNNGMSPPVEKDRLSGERQERRVS